MLNEERDRRLVKEIEAKFGKVIDLDRSPFVLIEILRQFGHRFTRGGESGVDDGVDGVSTIAVGVEGPPPDRAIDTAAILRAILVVQRELKTVSRKLDRKAPVRSAQASSRKSRTSRR